MKKKFKVNLLMISLLTANFDCKADGEDVCKAVTLGSIISAAGYGLYKIHENYSLKRDLRQLNKDVQDSEQISLINQLDQTLNPESKDQEIIADIGNFEHNLKRATNAQHILSKIQDRTNRVLSSWFNRSKGEYLYNSALQLRDINKSRLDTAVSLKNYLENRTNLVKAFRICTQEGKLLYSHLLETQLVTEQDIRACFPESLYPLREAYNALNSRQQIYQAQENNLRNLNIQTTTSQNLINKITAYEQKYLAIKRQVAGLPNYTQDLKLEKEIQDRNRQLAIAQAQLEAEQKRARAAEEQVRIQQQQVEASNRQARAQESGLRYHKEQELAQLQSRLADLKLRQNRGENNYREIREVEKRISELKIDLYGLWGLFY